MHTSRKTYLLLTFLFYFQPISAQYIVTIAGNGINGTSGNNGPALCAGIPNPGSIAYDGKNTIYLTTSNSIRKLDITSGIISSVCGSDNYGATGDGGQAINALLTGPVGLCVDSVNKVLYVSEYSGNGIRKIDLKTGIITTFSGKGFAGFDGDGGLAINATLDRPRGLCLDYRGNFYICDSYNSRIRKVNLATGIITTVAGTGSTFFSGDGGYAINAGTPYPVDICSDHEGNIYFAEVYVGTASCVRKINAATGIITTVAGNNLYAFGGDNGQAENASLFNPSAIFVDRRNNLYISEYDDSRIRKIDASSGVITTIAGNGNNGFFGDGSRAVNGVLYYPRGLTMDQNNNLYIADNFNHRIRKITADTSSKASGVSTINITASDNNICTNTNIKFTAITANAGLNPSFQWKVNGAGIGGNVSIFSDSGLINGDVVSCVLTIDSSFKCLQNYKVNSNSIKMVIGPGLTSSAKLLYAGDSVCQGSMFSVRADLINCGTNPVIQWWVNGSLSDASNGISLTIVPGNNTQIYCKVIPDVPNCSVARVYSDTVAVKVKNVPSLTLIPSDTSVLSGTQIQFHAPDFSNNAIAYFHWLPPASFINPVVANPQTIPLTVNTTFLFVAELNNGCPDTASDRISILNNYMAMPDAFTPNGDDLNDEFRIPQGAPITLKSFEVYNNFGNRIFSTTDKNIGWDGKYKGVKQNSGVYVYIIRYIQNNKETVIKGSVFLIR